jgi:hypothetical protein
MPVRAPRVIHGDRDRISVLETKVGAIETKVDEIHQLLFGAKAILWFVTKVGGVAGGLAALAASTIAIWKVFGP